MNDPTLPTLSRPYAHYGLRTAAADGTSYGRFQWPESGTVTAPDWQPNAKCGNGLHALLNGEGTATVGEWGRIQIEWWDGYRYRISIGYAGENGIKPDTAYRLDNAGQFVEVGK